MDDLKKKAKLDVLKEARSLASRLMQDGLSEKMKKVVVAAQDKEGLKAGLNKAEEVLEQMPEEECITESLEEMPEEESLDEIEEQIKKLEEKKQALLNKA